MISRRSVITGAAAACAAMTVPVATIANVRQVDRLARPPGAVKLWLSQPINYPGDDPECDRLIWLDGEGQVLRVDDLGVAGADVWLAARSSSHSLNCY